MSVYDAALDAQMDWANYWTSGNGVNDYTAVVKHLQKKREEAGEKPSYDMTELISDDILVTSVALLNGECFYWSPEILDIVASASQSLPGSWTLTHQHLPALVGFFYCAKELTVPGLPGAIKGFGWACMNRERDKTLAPAAISLAHSDTPIEKHNAISLLFFTETQVFKFPCPSIWSMYFGESLDDWQAIINKRFEMENADLKFVDEEMEAYRLFCTMLAFLQQRLLVTEHHHASRASWRRAAQLREVDTRINVVKLRAVQRHASKGNGDPIEYSCQWIVRGHWRDQWYPSLKKNQPIWISPYIKGPEDKPLRDPKRLFAVVR